MSHVQTINNTEYTCAEPGHRVSAAAEAEIPAEGERRARGGSTELREREDAELITCINGM